MDNVIDTDLDTFVEGRDVSIEEMFKPKPLEHYMGMAKAGTYPAQLSTEQAAAVLKAHDHGIAALSQEEIALLDQVMSILKEEIWP